MKEGPLSVIYPALTFNLTFLVAHDKTTSTVELEERER